LIARAFPNPSRISGYARNTIASTIAYNRN
jgi:hypothetical protein